MLQFAKYQDCRNSKGCQTTRGRRPSAILQSEEFLHVKKYIVHLVKSFTSILVTCVNNFFHEACKYFALSKQSIAYLSINENCVFPSFCKKEEYRRKSSIANLWSTK